MKKPVKKQVAVYLTKKQITWLKKEKKKQKRTGNAILLDILDAHIEESNNAKS